MDGGNNNGNNELTREILRTELRAGLAEQSLSFRKEMDKRFEPVNSHIARIERGEFTDAQKAAILGVVDGYKDKQLERRSMRAPIVAVLLSAIALLSTIFLTLTTSGVIQ